MDQYFGYYENRKAMIACIVLLALKAIATIFYPFFGFLSIWLLSMQLPFGEGITNGLPIPVLLIDGLLCAVIMSIFIVFLFLNRRISSFASLVLLIVSIADVLANLLLIREFSFSQFFLPLLFHAGALVSLILLRRSKNDYYL